MSSATKVQILPEGVDPKQFWPDVKHMIIYSFTIGDRHYFRFDDPFNVPYDRALKCLTFWRAMDMNCDRDFLMAHTEAMNNILNTMPFGMNNLLDIRNLNDQLKQRLLLPKEPDLMYQMAAITFFDQHENPYTYEFGYGEKKIKHWKKTTELTDFFLQKPVMELIPYLQHAGENLEQFSQMTQKVTKQHIESILPHLSKELKMILQGKLNSSPAL